MSPSERREHVLELVDQLGAVLVVDEEIVCLTQGGCDDEQQHGMMAVTAPFPGAPRVGIAYLRYEPGQDAMDYLVTLHELGHLAELRRGGEWRLTPLSGRTRCQEAHAWRWAVQHSREPLGPDEWAGIAWYLRTYCHSRLWTCDSFDRLLSEAEREAA